MPIDLFICLFIEVDNQSLKTSSLVKVRLVMVFYTCIHWDAVVYVDVQCNVSVVSLFVSCSKVHSISATALMSGPSRTRRTASTKVLLIAGSTASTTSTILGR